MPIILFWQTNRTATCLQASLGEIKKDKANESICIFVNIDGKKLVLGTLSPEKLPQQVFDLVFDKEFQLSHNWKNGSVYFYGYMAPNTYDDGYPLHAHFPYIFPVIYEIFCVCTCCYVYHFDWCYCLPWLCFFFFFFLLWLHPAMNQVSLLPLQLFTDLYYSVVLIYIFSQILRTIFHFMLRTMV